MGSTSDLKNGAVIKYNGENSIVLDVEFRKPGKGGAFFKVKLRNMKTGRNGEHTYNSGESIDFVRVERHTYQYLYKEASHFVFMNMTNYEQVSLDDSMVGEESRFMKENTEVQLGMEGETVIFVEIPQHINLRITYTEPGMKGDTATNSLKPATLETGAEVKVPLFCNEGDMIRLDTKTGAYIERVKE